MPNHARQIRRVGVIAPALIIALVVAMMPLGGIDAAPGAPGAPQGLPVTLPPAPGGDALPPEEPTEPVELQIHEPGHDPPIPPAIPPLPTLPPIPPIPPILFTICHIPPEDPSALHEIQVSPTDLGEHLAHGDHIGSCDGGPGVDKVTICHVPPGNPENAHTITIGEPAVAAHLAHGDEEGACGPDEAPGGEPDVALDKQLVFVELADGFRLGFRLHVENLGNATAEDVELFDTLPDFGEPWTLAGPDAGDCELDGLELTCAFGDLEPGETRAVGVRLDFDAFPCGLVIENEAEVTARADANLRNNIDDVFEILPDCPEGPSGPDVHLVKAGAFNLLEDGFSITYTLAVTNVGDVTAEDVHLLDTLPDLGVPWTLADGADEDDCTIDGLDLECTLGDLEPGESRLVGVAAVAPGEPCGLVLDNQAEATSFFDVNLTNNTASFLMEFAECPADQGDPDVALDKDVTQTEENGLDQVTFTFVVTSIGNETATGVVLLDTLADLGTTWTLGGPDAAACELLGLDLVCSFGDLEPGGERIVEVSSALCDLGCGPDLRNVAEVLADEDADLSNNSDSAVIVREPCPEPEPEPVADVGLEKQGAVEALEGGGFTIAFGFIVTSLGDATALNVSLVDDLPSFDWTLEGPDAADCTIEKGTLLCAFGDLEPGEVREVGVRAEPCSFSCGAIENTAQVAAINDLVAGNDIGTVILELSECPRFAR